MADQPNNTSSTGAVRDAINNTPCGYLLATLGIHSRSFNEDAAATLQWALKADWEEFEHPSIQAPAKGYVAIRAGFQLVMPIEECGSGDIITFDPLDAKSDRTGVVMGNVVGYSGPVVAHVVALVGLGDKDEQVLWTLHAGDPIRPTGLETAKYAGSQMTAGYAAELGVTHVRCGI